MDDRLKVGTRVSWKALAGNRVFTGMIAIGAMRGYGPGFVFVRCDEGRHLSGWIEERKLRECHG